MTFKQVILAIIGKRRQDDNQEEIYRRMTLIIASTGFAGKKVSSKFDKMWPSRMKRQGLSVADKGKEVLNKFREREALKKANDKLNARRS